MRHRKKFNHLGRKKGHRMSMLANMSSSLIIHKRINTTLAKAKALKRFIEPLITKSKSDTTHNRRIVFSRIKQKNAISELFRNIAVKVGDRPGGYTRIIRLGNRLGDNAEMAMIELVDYNELYVSTKKKTTRRSRRGNKKEKLTDIKDSDKAKDDIVESINVEVPSKESPVEESSVKDSSVEEVPAEEAPAEEVPSKESPVKESSVEEAPAEEVPAEEVPAEEVPAEEVPSKESPVEESSVEEAPAEEVPAEEAPSDKDKKEKK